MTGAAVSLVVLAGVLLLLLHTPPARRYLLSQVTELLQQQNVSFGADQLGYNLLELSLSLRNLQVRSQDAPDLPPFARIDRVTLDLSLTSLVRGRYVLESGGARGVAVHYVVDEQGRDNLPRPPSDPDEPGEPLDYLIEDLRIEDARVRYEHRAEDMDVSVPVASIHVTGDPITDRHTLALRAGGGRVALQDRTFTIESLTGEVSAGDDDAAIERIELTAEGAVVTLTGKVTGFEEPALDLELRGAADAARASRIAGFTEPVGGRVELDARIGGTLKAPDVRAQVRATDASYRSLSDVQLAAVAGYDGGGQRVTLQELDVRAPFGEVSGRGAVALEGAGASRVTLTLSNLDAGRVMRALDLPVIVATRADAQVQAEWPGLEYLQASGDATATLTPTARRASRSTVPAAGRIAVTGRGGTIVAALTGLRAGGTELDGRVRVVDRKRLGGRVRLQIDDVARAASVAEAVLGRPAGTLLPTSIAGGVSASALLGGTVSSPRVTADVTAPSLRVGGLEDVALNAKATYSPSRLAVDTVDVRWAQAAIHADGTIGLEDPQRLQLEIDADRIQIAEVLRALEQSGMPASGVVSLQGTLAGTASRPVGRFTVSGDGLEAYGERWGVLTARVNLTERELAVAELTLRKPQPGGDGRLTADGTYHLDRRTFSVDLRSDNLRLVDLTLPGGQELRGGIALAARGRGTVDDPEGTLELTARDLQFDGHDYGRVALGARLADQQATIDATAPAFGVTADARIGIGAPYPATAAVRVENLQLARLPIELTTPLEGTLEATVKADGPLQTPAAMTADATIQALAGTWNGQPFRVDAPSRLGYANERITIDRLRLVARDSTVAVSGELPASREGAPGEIRIDARANLATLASYAPKDTELSGTGDLTLTGMIRGTLEAVDPSLTLTVANGGVTSPRLEPGLSGLNVTARVGDGAVALERLDASFGSAQIRAEGRVPFDALPDLPVELPAGSGTATFTASVRGLDLAQVPGAPEALGGRVSVEAQASAERAGDLASLDGRVAFEELQVVFNELTLGQEQPSRLTVSGGTARVEQFALSGSVGTLRASGTAALTGERSLDLELDGTLDIAALSAFTDAVRAQGEATLQVAAGGTLESPDLQGAVALADATLIVDEPTVAVENLDTRLALAGRRITVETLTGEVNGGSLTGSGFVELGEGGIADAALEIAADDVANDFPLDLRSLSDTRLRLTRRDDLFHLEGQVTIDEAGLTGDVNFDEGLLAAITSRRRLDLTEERDPFLERLRFDVGVATATPILVENNLARAEVETDLRVLGTPYEPGLSGRLTVLEGGEIILNEREYEVERGVVRFIGEREIIPSMDLLLLTEARNHDITLAVTGTPGDTDTSLTAVPALPEPDIMALLVTGRTLEEMRGEEFEVAQEQVLSYLTGRVGSQLGRGLERATGLSTVRVEPNLIAGETDPSARLTVGQDITGDLELIYSVDLTNSNDQIWIAEYDITRRFQSRVIRQSDDSYRLDFRHDVRFGGRPEPRRMPRERPPVASVSIESDGELTEAELRKLFDVEAGDEFDFFDVRGAADEVREALAARGRLQSRVRVQREKTDAGVAVTLQVRSGPRVEIAYEGAEPPDEVADEVRRQWQRGVFDAQRIDDGVEALRGWLMSENYLQAEVTGEVVEAGPDLRRARFVLEPGTAFDKVVLAFEGASGIDPDVLDEIVEEQDLELALFTDPVQVTELLERYYGEQGYLVAGVDEPRYEFAGSEARVVLAVTEGPRFIVRRVTAAGNAAIPTPELVGPLAVTTGDPFLPFAAENALQQIRDVYWARGYNDVRPDYEVTLDRDAGRVDVRFTIEEGPRSVVAGIAIEGTQQTADRFVRGQVELLPSQPLDLKALARSRANLYDTRAFSLVDITREELPADGGDQPVQLTVEVREVQPVQLRYGASYDTERGLGGLVDLSNHNTLGKARIVGIRSRYDSQVREVRGYFNQPALKAWPVETTLNVYLREERNPETERTGRFDIDRRGISVQQERELRNRYLWSYGFRYERARSFDPLPGGLLDERVTVAPLSSTFTRETRDEVLDATRGAFLSHAFQYSPSWLGADQGYVKYFGQYFRYVPLQPLRRERFTGEVLRPRLVLAGGARLGLAHAFDGALPLSERFFAGGSTTLRGFEQNAVGPVGADRIPLGGEAMLVLNGELRFPLIGIFDGAAFVDVGNVFRDASDFALSDLRESGGIGIRVRTPWFLGRVDYGVPFDRRPGEARSRLYFSIGQAF